MTLRPEEAVELSALVAKVVVRSEMLSRVEEARLRQLQAAQFSASSLPPRPPKDEGDGDR